MASEWVFPMKTMRAPQKQLRKAPSVGGGLSRGWLIKKKAGFDVGYGSRGRFARCRTQKEDSNILKVKAVRLFQVIT